EPTPRRRRQILNRWAAATGAVTASAVPAPADQRRRARDAKLSALASTTRPVAVFREPSPAPSDASSSAYASGVPSELPSTGPRASSLIQRWREIEAIGPTTPRPGGDPAVSDSDTGSPRGRVGCIVKKISGRLLPSPPPPPLPPPPPPLLLLQPTCVGGHTGMPAGIRYPRIADTGMIFYPWRIAGTDTGTDFCSWIRICRATIRADFARCHLKVQDWICYCEGVELVGEIAWRSRGTRRRKGRSARRVSEVAQKNSSPVCDAEPGAEEECRAFLKHDVDGVVGVECH
ncbi:hypothetical protein BAE44_0000981, partial [Dichanthelium oligosanthes]